MQLHGLHQVYHEEKVDRGRESNIQRKAEGVHYHLKSIMGKRWTEEEKATFNGRLKEYITISSL